MHTKDKEVQESLKQSEEKFKEIIKNAPIAIYEIDFDGSKIRTVNSAVSQWLGYSEEEILAMNPLNLLGEESKKKFQEIVKEALTGNKTLYSSEFEVRAKNGQSIWGLFHAKINFKNGKPDTVLVFAQDITELKKHEKALMESEERFRQLVMNSPDTIYSLDTIKHKALFLNRDEFLGYTREQLLGSNSILYAVHPDDQDLVKGYWQQVMQGTPDGLKPVEYRLRSKAGVWEWVHSRTVVLERDEQGKPCHLLVNLSVITERKKTEEALENTKEKLESIISAIDDGVAMVGLDGKVVDCNKASEKLLGLTREEFIGTNVYDIVVPEDRQKALQGAFKVLETGRIVNHVRVLRKNSSAFDAEISVTAVYDKNGKPVSFVGVTRDVTERKKADEAIKQSEKKLQNIIDAMDDGIVLLGMDGKVIDCNQATLFQFKMKREEVIGKVIMDLMFSENKENFIKETQDVLQKTGKATVETHLQRKNDSPLSVEVSLTRFYDQNRRPMGLLGVARDITERKKAEDKLMEAQAKLQEYATDLAKLVEERTKQLQDKERLAAIGQTAGMVGHDIRNPLQAIVSELFLAKQVMAEAKDKDTREALESINLIQDQVDYISKIVADLQDYARPLNPEYTIVDLPDLIASVFDTIVLSDKIKLKVDVKGPLKLKTDPTFVKRAITNLVNNAIQAMPDGGELGLYAQKKEECVVFSVSDTGHGIPEVVKANLFTPLMTTKAKGQGLGLAVVKRLVEALNGQVSFESEEGKGTKFIIELPNIQ